MLLVHVCILAAAASDEQLDLCEDGPRMPTSAGATRQGWGERLNREEMGQGELL